jgi:hypothetical protein
VTKDKHALVRNNLLHVGLSSIDTHTVNIPPNIQARGLYIPRRGATAHCSDRKR